MKPSTNYPGTPISRWPGSPKPPGGNHSKPPIGSPALPLYLPPQLSELQLVLGRPGHTVCLLCVLLSLSLLSGPGRAFPLCCLCKESRCGSCTSGHQSGSGPLNRGDGVAAVGTSPAQGPVLTGAPHSPACLPRRAGGFSTWVRAAGQGPLSSRCKVTRAGIGTA